MSDQTIDQARSALLEPTGLRDHDLDELLGAMMRPGVDYADLYFQRSRSESWMIEDGMVRSGSFDLEQGMGARALSGEKTGFAYSDELHLPALEAASSAAGAIARSGGVMTATRGQQAQAPARYAAVDPLNSLPTPEKLSLLERADKAARAADSRVIQVIANVVGVHEEILVAASDGTLAGDIRPLVRFGVQVTVEQDGRRERAHAGGGGRFGYEQMADGDRIEAMAREAVRIALVKLEAQPAPAGAMPVVLGPGWPGVLLHEAVGHGLEGDFNRKGSSTYSGRVGEQVAAKGVTVVDDGTMADRRGSLTIDDEGTPSGRNVLIEDGILRGYMQDKQNARLMGVPPTGNGRRESYAHLPMPRMTNTFMLAGQDEPEAIIASVERGIYAVNFDGGQVDITSGNFTFTTSEAYLIEQGKVTAPIKGATLIGNGPDALARISMIGNDLALDDGIGVCGKDGQSLPVGVGQPTIKVDELTVGGTQAG
ncbi:MAG: metalloprotease TldD [Abyssibacter sp.]|uniref:metalloprotease TldD n=1 Tax=Abyssibacter sp. TaxID=2320200 RepID=UPI002EB33309|nr:metalloprotease TldD [Pseudomonadota bacterium]